MPLLIFLVIIGVLCAVIPMEPMIKNIVVAVVVILALVWLLNHLGIGTGLRIRTNRRTRPAGKILARHGVGG